jgi:hypothetical protein
VDKQLEEQLERMRRLNEQLTAIRRGVAENTQHMQHGAMQRSGPLEVRDLRTYQWPDYNDFSSADAVRPSAGGEAGDSSRRRRRR